uniref:RING-type domain-containing protein n=1 Tax=Kalanchoe fedtschenkoi TaxID=63787 RepID=A0A7N0TN59_KALFE
MWSCASNAIAGAFRLKANNSRRSQTHSKFSDEDEVPSSNAAEEGLECPVCWEYFNVVENVPYVLWCGHTLCKSCVLGLQRAIIKFSTLPLELPLFISCPWCNLLSCRLVYKGNLKFPRKNFFLLWMVESMNGDRSKSHSSRCSNHQPAWSLSHAISSSNRRTPLNRRPVLTNQPQPQEIRGHPFSRYLVLQNLQTSLHKSFVFFARLTAKFSLIVMCLLILLYAIPVTATILLVYVLFTFLFAFPSLLVLYFAYPSLDWLIKEIIN